MGLLTFKMADPTGYGRIVRNERDQVESIVEQKDATAEQLLISEVNTGVMAVLGRHLHNWLPQLSDDNAQKEYYLTDIISMAVKDSIEVLTTTAQSEIEITGVNSRRQQAQLERAFQERCADHLLDSGLSISDPRRFDLRGTLEHGEDSVVDVNCIFEGDVKLGNAVVIGANCVIRNSTIGDGCEIKANSIVEDAVIASNCVVGPFARLRPGTELADGAKIGNFVETKKAKVGKGSKINHLSYVGDAELGTDVNVGAGTITCNYDGVNKSLTTIGDNAFIGSNSALVAPVALAKNTTVAAGSTITKDSEENQLVLARAKQKNLDGWQRPNKKNQ
jgi:bifunctional UDP-N-acetylglucosamine pyrophosphorylase/glucosamine-1-phosphate N-acetyltransferase